MTDQIRFEIYVPTIFTTKEKDPRTGIVEKTQRDLDPALVEAFINETIDKFGGITQANPLSAPAFKGFWFNEEKNDIDVDFSTYLITYIPQTDFLEAQEHFIGWGKNFVRELNQSSMLIACWPVKTILVSAEKENLKPANIVRVVMGSYRRILRNIKRVFS